MELNRQYNSSEVIPLLQTVVRYSNQPPKEAIFKKENQACTKYLQTLFNLTFILSAHLIVTVKRVREFQDLAVQDKDKMITQSSWRKHPPLPLHTPYPIISLPCRGVPAFLHCPLLHAPRQRRGQQCCFIGLYMWVHRHQACVYAQLTNEVDVLVLCIVQAQHSKRQLQFQSCCRVGTCEGSRRQQVVISISCSGYIILKKRCCRYRGRSQNRFRLNSFRDQQSVLCTIVPFTRAAFLSREESQPQHLLTVITLFSIYSDLSVSVFVSSESS